MSQGHRRDKVAARMADTAAQALPVKEHRDSLVASAAAIPLENLGWDKPRAQEPWQRELWRLLDITGELRYPANWVASHISRSVLKMCDVKDDGEIGGETKNPKARKIASTVFGNAAQRREIMRTIGFNMWLVGEVYIGALNEVGRRKKDQWFAVSVNDIKRDPGGGAWIDLGHGKQVLRPGRDLLLRCWTPHPNRAAEADSAPRSVRIILRELEKLTLFIFAQIDSRLASGGVFVVPAGMASADGQISAKDLMMSFIDVASKALKGEGTAAGVVPLVLEVPDDVVDKVQHVTFSTELSDKAMKLREEAISRLAKDLDVPTEEMTGVGDTNHWSSYTIGPTGIKNHIEPLLARLCQALQQTWVEPALEAAGLNPDKYHIWYDTTPLTVRPQQFQEAIELWREGLLSAASVLDAAGFYDNDAPAEDEDVRRYLRELVLRDPQLFNQSSIRAALGISAKLVPTTVEQPADGQLLTDSKTPAPPPPAPEKVPSDPVTGRPPVSRQRQPGGVTASGAVYNPTELATLVIADAVSLRALELAGGRLLDHTTRGHLREVPRHELHTRIPVGDRDLDRLLVGWDETVRTLTLTVGVSEDDTDRLVSALRAHCEDTLVSGRPHDRERLISRLQVAKVVSCGLS